MSDEPLASRRELDQLRDRIERIDDHGTRGVGTLQSQITDMIKDIAELKTDLNTRFEAHQRIHDQDHQDRISGRRWLIATGIAGLGSMGGVWALLWDILQHLHH
jgi:TolA-binding protein